jgi:RimJ/RimL family protein N-acetyltransferase
MSDVTSFSIPRLLTPRLVLRPFARADFPAYAANAADPEAVAFIGGVQDTRNAWRFFCSATGSWVLGAGGWLAVTLPEDDVMLGTVGVFRREIAPDLTEVGWAIFRPHWKKGYAAEAARAVVDYAFREWKDERVIAYIADGNTASIGVGRSIGMTYDGAGDFYGEPCGRYAITKAR